MSEVTKSIDMKTNKVTYSKEFGSRKYETLASCEVEALDKLDRMIVDDLGVDGIVKVSIDIISVKYQGELDHLIETHSTQLLDVRQELLAAITKPWYRVLLARILWMQ